MSFVLDEGQAERYNAWNIEHKKVCKYTNNGSGAIGGRLTFSFTPTGLGDVVEVSCACGEKINLTNYDDW